MQNATIQPRPRSGIWLLWDWLSSLFSSNDVPGLKYKQVGDLWVADGKDVILDENDFVYENDDE